MAVIEDVLISELPRAADFESGDLLVLQRDEKALAVPETVLIAELTKAADGHGGIKEIRQTGSSGDTAQGATRTYTVYYTDGTKWSFSVKDGGQGIQGVQGAKGDTGDPARVSGSRTQYGVSDAADTLPTTWSNSPPVGIGGQYIWTKVTIVYNDTTEVSYNVVSRLGRDGRGAVSSVNNVAPDSVGNVTLAAGDIGYKDSNVEAALNSTQTKISVSGLLKGDGAGGVSAASAGTDYQEPAVALRLTLATDGAITREDSEGRHSVWAVRNTKIRARDHLIVAPAPESLDAWTAAELRADDVLVDGLLHFECPESLRPAVDVRVYVLVIRG